MLACGCGNEQVELGQHLAGGAQFLEKFRAFYGGFLIHRPQTEY